MQIKKRFSLYKQRVLCLTIWKKIADLLGLIKGSIVEVIYDDETPNQFIVRKIVEEETPTEE